MNPIELSVFSSRLIAVCDEMGAVLRKAAFSPNIRDRLDFSCALFDAEGQLVAQAAHIPVHLGSMAFAMGEVVRDLDWQPGSMLVFNDPFLGGTHLPDVTLVAPVFAAGELQAFVVNRAHHADIGASAHGSMPLSRHIGEEGLLIPPTWMVRDDRLDQPLLRRLGAAQGDFLAQISANRAGMRRLGSLLEEMGSPVFRQGLVELNDYGERMARSTLAQLPAGRFSFRDYLDDDGQGNRRIAIAVTVVIDGSSVAVDFAGTSGQVAGNVNCPLSVAAAAVYYVFRCLMPRQTPNCAGSFRPVSISAPPASLVNARSPAAVTAGNVETSNRIVDALLGALAQAIPERVPAASQGTMNNLAMGGMQPQRWDYYETIGGGAGAGPLYPGLTALQSHMTNTLNTPIEVLESQYPIRVEQYRIRTGSGGSGQHRGGDGVIKEFLFLAPTEVTLLSERRDLAPWGLAGGGSGRPGLNCVNDRPLPGKVRVSLAAGDRLRVETPGGGGWGD